MTGKTKVFISQTFLLMREKNDFLEYYNKTDGEKKLLFEEFYKSLKTFTTATYKR